MDVPLIFDRKLYLARQACASGEAVALLDTHIAGELSDRLSVINHQFAHAVVIAQRTGLATEVLQRSGKIARITQHAPPPDDDLKLEAASADAIFSLLDLQNINDVPGYLAQIAHALRPDGLAMLGFFAGESLGELRQAWLQAETRLKGGVSPRVAPMIDLRETGGLLQRAGLALPVSDLDRVVLRYANALALMREVKALGFANALIGRSGTFTSRRLLYAAAEALAAADDGRIPLTVEIAWAMAWKPHPSQQQPLKPGSAKARLADALKIPSGNHT